MEETRTDSLSSLSNLSKNEKMFLKIINTCSHDISPSDFENLSVYMNTLFDSSSIPDQFIPIYIDLCFYFSGLYRERHQYKPVITHSSNPRLQQVSSEAWELLWQHAIDNTSYNELKLNTYAKLFLRDKAAAYAAILAFQNAEGLNSETTEESVLTYDFQFAIFRNKGDKYRKLLTLNTAYLQNETDDAVVDKFMTGLISMFEQYSEGTKLLLKEFEAQDFWEIIHFHNLPEKSTRMGFRQISRAKTNFGNLHPATKSIILNVLRSEMSLDPDVEKYPIGGFAEITNSCSNLDNIVRTEFVYCGEKISKNFDIFDLRMVKKETTYYERDQSISFDPKRYLCISMHQMNDLNHKVKEQPYQLKILTIAIVSKFVDDFLSIFKKTASKIDIFCDKETQNIFLTLYQREIDTGFINLIEEVEYEKYSSVIAVNTESENFISLIPGNTFKVKADMKTERFVFSNENMRKVVDSLLIASSKIKNKSFFISLKEATKLGASMRKARIKKNKEESV